MHGVNDSGSVIVGSCRSFDFSFTMACIWTPARGTEFLADYLAANGVTIPAGWTLADCTSVDSTGMVFAGSAYNASGGGEGFVAYVPTPSTFVVLFLLPAMNYRRRSR